MKPISNITVLDQLGFRDPAPFEFTDAAASFIKASCKLIFHLVSRAVFAHVILELALYDIGPPPFIRFLPSAAWTSTRIVRWPPFQSTLQSLTNIGLQAVHNLDEDGTVKAHTVCLRSMVSCEAVSAPTLNAARTTISGSTSSCTFSSSTTQSIGADASIPFGISLASCPYLKAPSKLENSAVAFWVLGGSNGSTPIAAVCTPRLLVQRADVLLNTTTSALLLVDNQTPLLPRDENSNASLTSAPFNGSAFNGWVSCIAAVPNDNLVNCGGFSDYWSIRVFFSSVTGAASTLNLNSTQFGLGQAIANFYKKNDTTISNSATFNLVVADAYGHCEF